MKVAITGASGFIGRYVLNALMSQEQDVLVTGQTTVPKNNGRIIFIEADLVEADPNSWLSVHRPTHLIHLAWYAEHEKFWDSPLNWKWRDATARLAEAFCKHGGRRLVVAGSCAEYDWSYGYCREDTTPINPSTPYGLAKDQSRQMVQEICDKYDTEFAWGRIFLPFGVGENPRRLVPSIVHGLLGWRAPFAINTQYCRDIIPVCSVADGFVYLLNQKISGVFNVCSGVSTQLSELIQYLGRVLNRDPEPLLAQSVNQADVPRLLVGDNSLLLKTGWRPSFDLRESLARYAEYLADTRPSP